MAASTSTTQGHFPWGYEIYAKTDKGVRDVNEDTYVVVEHYNDLFTLKRAPPQVYVGLFDGHSGKEAAEFCRYDRPPPLLV